MGIDAAASGNKPIGPVSPSGPLTRLAPAQPATPGATPPAAIPARDAGPAAATGQSALQLGAQVATPQASQALLRTAAGTFRQQGNREMADGLTALADMPMAPATAQVLAQRADELSRSPLPWQQDAEGMLDGMAAELLQEGTGTAAAIATGYRALGEPAKADAMQALADPGVSGPVRDTLAEALYADPSQRGYLVADAQAAAATPADQQAVAAFGEAWLGAQHLDELAATREVGHAEQAYQAAVKQCEAASATLEQGLAQIQGLPAEQQAAFVQAFRAAHPEFAAVDEARAELVQAVNQHQDGIAAAMADGQPLSGVDPGAMETALAVAAQDPGGQAAAAKIATAVLAHAGDVPGERLDAVMKALPDVVGGQLASLASAGVQGPAAAQALEQSPLGQAIANLAAPPDARALGERFTGMTRALAAGDPQGALAAMQGDPAGPPNPALTATLGAIAAVVGVASVESAHDFLEGVGRMIGATSNDASYYSQFCKVLAMFGKELPTGFADKLAGAAGAVSLGIAAVHDGLKGNYVDAGFEGVAGVLLVAAMATGSGPLGWAVGAVCAAQQGYHMVLAVQADHAHRAEIQRALEGAKLDPALARFLAGSQPGAYATIKQNLGLTDADATRLLATPGPWQAWLGPLGTDAATAAGLKGLAPGGDVEALVTSVTSGLSPEEQTQALVLLTGIAREPGSLQARAEVLQPSQAVLDRFAGL
jgi:hypothetical protein